MDQIRFGTRGSELALWQTSYVVGLLRAAHPQIRFEVETIHTRGDKIQDTPLPLVGGKGLFTAELEDALRDGSIDCAVHSLKDLPTDAVRGLAVGAIPPRAHPADVLVSRKGHTLATLPRAATIGTSSLRRAAQLLHSRPDLHMLNVRGNVDTRIRKAMDPVRELDAIVLARAGLERLGRADVISQVLPFDTMLPAPGQGAIAVQCRANGPVRPLLAAIQDEATALAVSAERAFLAALGGGCSVPIAALATWQGAALILQGRVNTVDGREQIDVERAQVVANAEDALALGLEVAELARAAGASRLLEQRT